MTIRKNNTLSIITQRAGTLESRHEVDAVICDAAGHIIASYGDASRLVFPRSAIKPLQAIALVEILMNRQDGTVLSDDDASVICASHNGEQGHVDAVASLLSAYDISPTMLHCGAHWSTDQATALGQARAFEAPQKIHNNCSGKHAGMLVLGQLLAVDLHGYGDVGHPVQQAIIKVIDEMADMSVLDYPHGIDGCGAPAFSAPMDKWAQAFASFTQRDTARGQACARIANAIAASPFLMAGTGRACTDVNQAFGADVTVKIGAEGVYGIAANRFGLGAVLKVRDGNMRAAAVALGQILRDIGYEDRPELAPHFAPILTNWAGDEVGNIYAKTDA